MGDQLPNAIGCGLIGLFPFSSQRQPRRCRHLNHRCMVRQNPIKPFYPFKVWAIHRQSNFLSANRRQKRVYASFPTIRNRYGQNFRPRKKRQNLSFHDFADFLGAHCSFKGIRNQYNLIHQVPPSRNFGAASAGSTHFLSFCSA